jgi:hydroxymethylpyrimidine kinase/phosphomethylpyrimidine kinase
MPILDHTSEVPPVALTIAGSDSSGGAGVQIDLKVFQALGVHGACAVTALTAQDTRGVRRVHRVPPRFVAEQIDAAARDLPIAAAKTGMLHRAAIVEVAAERVRRRRLPNLVVDPVILAKDGTPLLDSRGLAALKKRLLPQALAVTPNVPEAAALSGVEIADLAGVREAARRIAALGVRAVIVKGGHLPGEPVDTLLWEDAFLEFPGARIGGPERAPVHGTGCLYSAALTALVAREVPLPEACARVKQLMEQALGEAAALGRGSLLFGPLRMVE